MGESLGSHPTEKKTYSEIFYEWFPFYLSIGMSSAEYWEGDPSLPQYYRKAFKMRQEQENRNAWLHGLYVYDATISALTHLNTDKSKHKAYAEKPYSFTPEAVEKDKEQKVVEEQAKAEVWMRQWASATRKMFKDKKTQAEA